MGEDLRSESYVLMEEQYYVRGGDVFKKYRIKTNNIWGKWVEVLTPLREPPYVLIKNL